MNFSRSQAVYQFSGKMILLQKSVELPVLIQTQIFTIGRYQLFNKVMSPMKITFKFFISDPIGLSFLPFFVSSFTSGTYKHPYTFDYLLNKRMKQENLLLNRFFFVKKSTNANIHWIPIIYNTRKNKESTPTSFCICKFLILWINLFFENQTPVLIR